MGDASQRDETRNRLRGEYTIQEEPTGGLTQEILRFRVHPNRVWRPATKILLCLLLVFSVSLFAQTATVRGVVTDPSGAVVPSARVTVKGANATTEAVSGNDGSYSVTGLTPGQYTVQAFAPQLAMPQPAPISLTGGVQTLNLQLSVAATTQEITVKENGPTVSTDPASNAGALVLRGTDLDALADDPDDLAADLQALAGPSAGPNGGQMFVD